MTTSTTNVVNFGQGNPVFTPNPLVVILVSGAGDGGKRATLAWMAAVTAAGMDTPTKLFLVGDGAYWGYEGRIDNIHVDGFPALTELVEAFAELGGETWICSACDQVCGIPGDGGSARRRRDVLPRGMAAILPDIAGGSSVTF